MRLTNLQFKTLFLGLSFFYYIGFLYYVTSFFGGKSDDAFTVNASGSLVNQVIGISLLLMSLTLLIRFKIVSVAEFYRSFFLWGLLIAWFIASISWSYEPSISFRRVVAFCTVVLVSYCLVQMFVPRSLLKFFVIVVFITASIGLVEAIVAPQKAFITSGHRAGAFVGFYFDKNGGARVYAYAILILIGLGLYKERWGAIALVVISLCLAMSRSATAVVMVLAGCSLMFMFKYLRANSASSNFIRLVLVLVALVFGGYLAFLLYDVLLGLLGRDANLTNRTIIWQLLEPYIIDEFTFGYGFGAFWASDAVTNFLDRWGFIGNAHSGYFEAMLQGGIVCIIILFSIVINAMYMLFKSYVYDQDGDLSTTLIPIFVVQIIVNYIGFIILNHNSVDMFIFLLAYFIANSRRSINN